MRQLPLSFLWPTLGATGGRYAWGVLLIVAVWRFAGGLVSSLLWPLPLGGVREFVATNVDFMLMMLGVVMVHVLVRHRPWCTLITSRPSLSWRRVFQGAALWGVLMLLFVGLESALYPVHYLWSFDPQRWPQFFVLALLLTPIQCTAEELLFRGYWLQAIGRVFHNPFVPAALSSLLFAAPHLLNPEATAHAC